MLLHSKFRDYYDTAIAYGVDTTCHYVRKTKEFFKDSIEYKEVSDIIDKTIVSRNGYSTFYVVFCDKVYKGVRCTDLYSKKYFYTKESLYNYAKSKKELHKLEYYNWFNKDNFFDYIPKDNKKLLEYQYKTGIPIILYGVSNEIFEGISVIYNPVLKDIEFYKVFNATSAFQELSMFISGVLGGQSPKMVELSDKYKIAKRGFNELSFRKSPNKRKKYG